MSSTLFQVFVFARNFQFFLLWIHLKGNTARSSRPHIVMIVADDLGWDDVGFHGSSQIPTPHMDELANTGVILNSYYVSPICTPTRASFMTGKYPVNLGLQHGTIFGTQPFGLPLNETTTPQYLKTMGYTTRGVGKWHLGFFEKEYIPTSRGFDSFYGYWTGKTDYWTHKSYEDYWGLDLRDNLKPVKNESGHYNTELFTTLAEKLINEHNVSKPLFLYIAHQAVHSGNIEEPLQAPQRLVDATTQQPKSQLQTPSSYATNVHTSTSSSERPILPFFTI
ncbi:arylsulfatase B-like [Stylophora pistillata]|uniref:arylsulfatase B-like n=1 Tax=Stylophora pistillata TaxID=50429 RepID=UPI000C04DC68|nr:arylsulfatase B-like [Stylophora pistillata]